jgi:hypothetical protein
MRSRSIVWVLLLLFFVLLVGTAEYVAAVKSSLPDATSASGDVATPNDGAGGDDDSRWTPPHYLP